MRYLASKSIIVYRGVDMFSSEMFMLLSKAPTYLDMASFTIDDDRYPLLVLETTVVSL